MNQCTIAVWIGNNEPVEITSNADVLNDEARVFLRNQAQRLIDEAGTPKPASETGQTCDEPGCGQ